MEWNHTHFKEQALYLKYAMFLFFHTLKFKEEKNDSLFLPSVMVF